MTSPHDAWIVEASKDGERWRFFGKAWVLPGERLLIHGLPRYVRVRRHEQQEFGEVMPRTGPEPMALLDLPAPARRSGRRPSTMASLCSCRVARSAAS